MLFCFFFMHACCKRILQSALSMTVGPLCTIGGAEGGLPSPGPSLTGIRPGATDEEELRQVWHLPVVGAGGRAVAAVELRPRAPLHATARAHLQRLVRTAALGVLRAQRQIAAEATTAAAARCAMTPTRQ